MPSVSPAFAVIALVMLGAVRGCGGQSATPVADVPAARAADGTRRVVGALGRIEPAGGVVHVAATPGDQVRQLLVAENDTVAAGDRLVVLAGDELRALEYDAACLQRAEAQERLRAQREVAAAVLAEAELGLEQADATAIEIAAQRIRITGSQDQAAVARQELARLQGLEPRLVPAQALARKQLLVAQAELEVQGQQAALERMEAAAALGRRVAAARLASARANAAAVEAAGSLAALDKAVEAAALKRDAALVRAPIAGRVIDIDVRPGEAVGPRPILRIADVAQMQVVAEVYEDDVRRVEVGQRVEARSRAIDGPLTGRVVGIGTLVSPNQVRELGMPATTEKRVVDVRIDLDDAARAARLIHLQVDVDFFEPAVPDGVARGPQP
jgi:HlyD family secretion protein